MTPTPAQGRKPARPILLRLVVRPKCDQRPPLSCVSAGQGHKGGESACTPDSVRTEVRGGHPSRPTVARRLERPTRGSDGRAVLSLLGLAPGGVCRAARVTPGAGALLPHRFTLTCAPAVPADRAIGGLLSVALSCGSPRLGVTQHPALWSPDVPRTGQAGTRPPGRLATASHATGRRCPKLSLSFHDGGSRPWPFHAVGSQGVAVLDLAHRCDISLVADLGRREQGAMAVYRRHGRPVLGLARRFVNDAGLAEDVVQEVFLQLWRAPERFDSDRGTLRSFCSSRRGAAVCGRRPSGRRPTQTAQGVARVPDLLRDRGSAAGRRRRRSRRGSPASIGRSSKAVNATLSSWPSSLVTPIRKWPSS